MINTKKEKQSKNLNIFELMAAFNHVMRSDPYAFYNLFANRRMDSIGATALLAALNEDWHFFKPKEVNARFQTRGEFVSLKKIIAEVGVPNGSQ